MAPNRHRMRLPLAAVMGALLCIGASIASAQAPAATPFCPKTVGRDLPSGSLDSRVLAIDPFVRMFKTLDESKLDVRAFLLLKDCTVVLERYKDGVTRDHNHAVYSVTKSVTSTLVGALLGDGRIAGLDLPISKLMARPPDTQETLWARAEAITLRNAMNMASGFAYTHNAAKSPLYGPRINRLKYALSQKSVAKPGTRFNYSDADVSITGAVVAAAAGEDLYVFARRTLFDPLQMVNHDWWFRIDGHYPGGWGLRLRPMDMLKLGQLYVQKGVWNGRKVFDPGYPALASAPGVSPRYGLHWWIGVRSDNAGAEQYAAIGFKGQRIYVFPGLGIVVAVVSSLPAQEESQLAGAILKAIRESVAQAGAGDGARAELDRLLRAGFRGETRMNQTVQDTPKLPST